MNREIKFRAWHPEWGEMVYSTAELVFEKREFCPFVLETGFSHYPKDDGWILMQFTGLHDRDGKEIYEGDLVEIQYNGLGTIVVEFHRGKFNIARYNLSHCRVIGNVHETPELIK